MNYIFSAIIILSLITSLFTGRINETVSAGLEGAKSSVEIVLSFAGIMCMWSGFLKLAQEGDLIKSISKIIHPVIRLLFPKLKKDSKATDYIALNMSANFLGVGNAATPAGIAAMSELDKENENSEYASDEMSIFTVVNTASIQLIPTTIIALRASFGSKSPENIIIPIWISSFCAFLCAVISMKLILSIRRKINRRRQER